MPVGAVDETLLDGLRTPLARRFGAGVGIGEGLELRADWYAPDREQYDADLVLDALVAGRRDPAWSLGIADVDLYAAGLSLVFGQATVSGCCALIGLARLRPEFYDARPEPALFFRRVLTEAVHELGHVAGLGHCPDPACVMHFSSTLTDTDRKGPDFCPFCDV